jgi:hypothetical protein
MKHIPDNLYHKIQQLDQSVKEKLRRQGVVVPVKGKNGTIQVGRYYIKKTDSGVYSIVDQRDESIVSGLNLPHTAVIIANGLALGKWIDSQVLQTDSRFGHEMFDEQLHTHLAEKNIAKHNLDQAELMYTKSSIAKTKKDRHKKEILNSFDKLIKFR